MFVDWFKNVSAMFVYVYEIYATGFSLLPALDPVVMPEWPGFHSFFNRLQVMECKELTFILLPF